VGRRVSAGDAQRHSESGSVAARMRGALGRLRWQLTLSHLIAIAFTLISMIAAVGVIGSTWWSAQNSPSREPAQDAHVVADAVGGIMRQGDWAGLNVVLSEIQARNLRLLASFGPPNNRASAGVDTALNNLAYIVVLSPDGRLVGSSDAAGSAFAPPERGAWQMAADQVMRSGRSEAVVTRPADGWTTGDPAASGPAALGASAIVNDLGQPIGAVVVGVSTLNADGQTTFSTVAAFGIATLVVLSGAFVFALASSTLLAYLLSRRLVRRLEELARAAEALRSGNLAARVPVGGTDEVAQLQRSFNAMAANLELSLGQLAAERDRVSGLLQARRQLVAGVSHELRTPVATMRGYLESALRRDGNVPTDLRADLDTMENELSRLQRLIDDLFMLARAEVGRLELRLEPTDVGALAKRLVTIQAPLAWRQRRVELVAEVADPLPLALVDAQRLEQIVSNLLSNAVRHTPPGGLVAVTVTPDQDNMRVDVHDTGGGIAPEALPRVFERFYHGEDASGGAGLGLALVKELTEVMGGTVAAASTPGEGTCFSVRLPLASPPDEL
jgi:signal transduction histidine kinase